MRLFDFPPAYKLKLFATWRYQGCVASHAPKFLKIYALSRFAHDVSIRHRRTLVYFPFVCEIFVTTDKAEAFIK